MLKHEAFVYLVPVVASLYLKKGILVLLSTSKYVGFRWLKLAPLGVTFVAKDGWPLVASRALPVGEDLGPILLLVTLAAKLLQEFREGASLVAGVAVGIN